MKTIEELNQKIWYRLLKVIYVCFFIILFLIISSLIYVNNNNKFKNINYDKSKIICIDGNKSTFNLRSLDFIIPERYFNNDKFDYNYFIKNNIIGYIDVLNKCEHEIIDIKETISGKSLDYKSFKVIPKYTYLYLIGKICLLSWIMVIVFELFRRVFYYIVLGKIIPSKK